MYREEFLGSGFAVPRVRRWEQAWLLEKVLVHAELTHETAFCIIGVVNLKQLEQINIWEGDELVEPIVRVFDFLVECEQGALTLEEKTQQFTFLIALYARPEVGRIAKRCLPFLSSALLVKSDKLVSAVCTTIVCST